MLGMRLGCRVAVLLSLYGASSLAAEPAFASGEPIAITPDGPGQIEGGGSKPPILRSDEAHPAQAEGVEKDGWKLGGSHVVLSLEHLATLTAWREIEDGGGTWGVEASALMANSTRRSMTEPRVAFDYVSPEQLTLGGSVGYVRSGGKQGKPNETQYVLAPRLGYLIAFDRIAIWLRAGPTLSSWSSTHETRDPPPCDDCQIYDGQLRRVAEKRRSYSLTLDPQLLVCLAPRVALSVGISLDEGLGGTYSQNYFTGFRPDVVDVTSSAYALISGISAIF